jgi:hypothetical protein
MRVALIGPTAALVVAAVVGLSCESGPPRPKFVQQATSALVQVGYPPPPARVEFIPRRPRAGAVWLDGEWAWSGSKWAWVAGRWVVAPPGAAFSPWTTVRDDQGNVYLAGGSWHDSGGAVLPPPPPLATAGSTEGDVTSPSGDDEKTGRHATPTSPAASAPAHS